MTRIEFERSGGFMGRKVTLNLNLDELPPDQAQTLSLLIDESDFFNLPDSPAKPPVPDSFLYTITVTTDTRQHTVHTSDTTAPERLRPLLIDLSARARAR
ncbi:MAG: hypothetical protein HZB19_04080 [Chloroflexi bacterium]|nr:hypothetical protein [Chloroflexota bacterium]